MGILIVLDVVSPVALWLKIGVPQEQRDFEAKLEPQPFL